MVHLPEVRGRCGCWSPRGTPPAGCSSSSSPAPAAPPPLPSPGAAAPAPAPPASSSRTPPQDREEITKSEILFYIFIIRIADT